MRKGTASPLKVAIWFESAKEVEDVAFMFFILSANAVQKSLVFFFPDPPEGLTFLRAKENLDQGREIYQDNFDVYVFVTSENLEKYVFSWRYGRLVFITSAGWDRHFSPPSLFHYLSNMIFSSAVYALVDSSFGMHKQYTMGCQFEYTRIKAHKRADIALGYICEDHGTKIAEQLGVQFLEDIEKLYSFEWLGKTDEANSAAHKLKGYFSYDMKQDSGFKKNFCERVQSNLDTIWFDFAKEIFKAIVLIIVTFLLIMFGLKKQ